MMKIIVSTKSLAVILKQAIDLNTTAFEVDGHNERIRFKSIGVPSLDLSGATTERHRQSELYKGVFIIETWKKILFFISQLEEQPIVMEFTHYMHTDVHLHPEIELSEFSKRFK